MYIDKLDNIVNECNNTCHRTIKMTPIDVKGNTYINIDKKVNNNDPKFQAVDRANWSEEFFVIKEIKNTVTWAYVINDINDEEIIETFYEKELQKIVQREFSIDIVTKKKGNKLYVKWKGYDNSFNSWIDKKDLV